MGHRASKDGTDNDGHEEKVGMKYQSSCRN